MRDERVSNRIIVAALVVVVSTTFFVEGDAWAWVPVAAALLVGWRVGKRLLR